MKRIVCAFICICLLCCAALADGIDLSKYSDAQILELLSQVQQEIVSRRIEKTANLRGGEYIAGEDIPTGKYVLTITYTGDWWANLTVYSERGNGKQKLWEMVTSDEGTFSKLITLEAGDKLTCDEPFELKVYAGVMFN